MDKAKSQEKVSKDLLDKKTEMKDTILQKHNQVKCQPVVTDTPAVVPKKIPDTSPSQPMTFYETVINDAVYEPDIVCEPKILQPILTRSMPRPVGIDFYNNTKPQAFQVKIQPENYKIQTIDYDSFDRDIILPGRLQNSHRTNGTELISQQIKRKYFYMIAGFSGFIFLLVFTIILLVAK
jgi:hypothetical protein